MSQDDLLIGMQIMHQMESVGFCLLTNVPGHDEQELLRAVKAYHELPQEMKMSMAPKHFAPENKNIYHGYFPFLESDVSHKEMYDMPRPLSDISEWERKGCPLYEFIPWVTTTKEHDWILESFQAYFKNMHTISLKLLRCLALGLGKDEEYFDAWFKDECSSVFRGIHYKPREISELNK